MAEFRGTKVIPVARPITAKVMSTTRGRINNNNPSRDQHMEEEEEQWEHNDNDVENEFITHEEHDQLEADFEDAYQEQQQGFQMEQGDLAKEIEEIKKFQVNQTLMGFRPGPIDKMDERIHETRNEIIEMHGQIKEWTRNASAREAYCC
ncbi:hypothetical protein PIB30_068719 [Stylosanthes scabra]|uniref:Uncharacterized protein n=1 Tax=Stylosanthes scabra TaxID=79078 RepID=A0ABU6WLD4_9FABA|nr:hypothetical protein [Stylosanthes scabra]